MFTVYLGFITLVLTQLFVYIFMLNSVSPIQLGHYHHLGMWSWPNQFWQCCSQIIIQIGANNYTVVRSRYSKRRCLAILPGPFHKQHCKFKLQHTPYIIQIHEQGKICPRFSFVLMVPRGCLGT